MPELIELSGIDYSQGLPVEDGAGDLGHLGAFEVLSSATLIGGGLMLLGGVYYFIGPRKRDPELYREMRKVFRTRAARQVANQPTRNTQWTAFGLLGLGASILFLMQPA